LLGLIQRGEACTFVARRMRSFLVVPRRIQALVRLERALGGSLCHKKLLGLIHNSGLEQEAQESVSYTLAAMSPQRLSARGVAICYWPATIGKRLRNDCETIGNLVRLRQSIGNCESGKFCFRTYRGWWAGVGYHPPQIDLGQPVHSVRGGPALPSSLRLARSARHFNQIQ
jgi:hypothetical protein